MPLQDRLTYWKHAAVDRLSLGTGQAAGCTGRIHICSFTLHLFDHLLVFFTCLDGRYAKGNDLQTADILPFCRKLII